MAANLSKDDARTPMTEEGSGLTKEAFTDWKRQIIIANEACDIANASRKAIRKRARGAGVVLKAMDAMITMSTWEPAEVREHFETEHQYAVWTELPGHKQLADQLDLFADIDPDEMSEDDWESKGYLAATSGLGVPCEAPEDCPGDRVQAWTRGWHRGMVKNAPAKLEVVKT
jgi:hypothetical protein